MRNTQSAGQTITLIAIRKKRKLHGSQQSNIYSFIRIYVTFPNKEPNYVRTYDKQRIRVCNDITHQPQPLEANRKRFDARIQCFAPICVGRLAKAPRNFGSTRKDFVCIYSADDEEWLLKSSLAPCLPIEFGTR